MPGSAGTQALGSISPWTDTTSWRWPAGPVAKLANSPWSGSVHRCSTFGFVADSLPRDLFREFASEIESGEAGEGAAARLAERLSDPVKRAQHERQVERLRSQYARPPIDA